MASDRWIWLDRIATRLVEGRAAGDRLPAHLRPGREGGRVIFEDPGNETIRSNRKSVYTRRKNRLQVRMENSMNMPVYSEELRRITFNAACNQAIDRSVREGVQCVAYEKPGAPATFYVRLSTEPAPEGAAEVYRTIDRRDPFCMHPLDAIADALAALSSPSPADETSEPALRDTGHDDPPNLR